MKNVLSYAVCSVVLFVAIVLVCGGGWYTLAGLVWSLAVYLSGDVFPTIWRRFWRSNMRILRYFDCL